MLRKSLLLTLFAAGCAGDDGSISLDDSAVDDSGMSEGDTDTDSDSDSDSDADSDSDTDCTAGISWVDPGTNTASVSITPTLKIYVDGEVSEGQASVTLAGPDGDVAGTLELQAGGTVVAFTPSTELARATKYEATFQVCETSETSKFETVGDAIESTGLDGRVYDVDLSKVTWNSPSSGKTIGGYIETNHVLLAVESADATSLDLVGAMGWEDPSLVQYPCAEAIDFDPADFTGNPHFTVGPVDTTFAFGGYAVPMLAFTIAGAFNTDGSAIENLRVSGYLDIRDVEYSGMAACDFIAYVGDSCTACPGDGVEGCVYMDVESKEAEYDATLTVDKAIDPSTNPDCP